MKKMKRFAGGNTVEGDASVAEQMEKTPAKKQSFSEAFAAARDRGDKDFAWEGKPGMKFSTKMREDKPAPKAESASSKPTSKAEEPAKPTPKAAESKGIGPYNVFSGPADADPEAVKAAKAAGDKRREKQAAAPMLHNPFRGAIDALRERGKKSNPDAYAKGGSVSSASKRADGIAQRGKTRGKMC
jgi:hypothetical protein